MQMHLTGYNHTPETIQMCEEYLKGNGLYVKGSVGIGKTSFFKALGSVYFASNPILSQFPNPSFYAIEMATLATKTKNDIVNFLAENEDNEVLLDDIGAESAMADYGIKFEPIPLIVAMRERSRKRTHITTNLTERQIYDRYGVRIVDRLRAFGVQITLTGTSQRTYSQDVPKFGFENRGYHVLRSAAEKEILEEKHRIAQNRINLIEYDD